MKSVILYTPINRELLSEIFQNNATANSYRKIGSGCYEIQMRDTKILTKYNQPHAVINLIDLKNEIERKELKHSLIKQQEK